MSHHRRWKPLLSILGGLGWTRDASLWTARCWDGDGRRSSVTVRLGNGFLALEIPASDLVYLSPVQAGRLRSALRDALLHLDRFAGEGLPEPAQQVRLAVRSVVPRQRRTVTLRPPKRPTVADLEAKLSPRAPVYAHPLPSWPRVEAVTAVSV